MRGLERGERIELTQIFADELARLARGTEPFTDAEVDALVLRMMRESNNILTRSVGDPQDSVPTWVRMTSPEAQQPTEQQPGRTNKRVIGADAWLNETENEAKASTAIHKRIRNAAATTLGLDPGAKNLSSRVSAIIDEATALTDQVKLALSLHAYNVIAGNLKGWPSGAAFDHYHTNVLSVIIADWNSFNPGRDKKRSNWLWALGERTMGDIDKVSGRIQNREIDMVWDDNLDEDDNWAAARRADVEAAARAATEADPDLGPDAAEDQLDFLTERMDRINALPIRRNWTRELRPVVRNVLNTLQRLFPAGSAIRRVFDQTITWRILPELIMNPRMITPSAALIQRFSEGGTGEAAIRRAWLGRSDSAVRKTGLLDFYRRVAESLNEIYNGDVEMGLPLETTIERSRQASEHFLDYLDGYDAAKNELAEAVPMPELDVEPGPVNQAEFAATGKPFTLVPDAREALTLIRNSARAASVGLNEATLARTIEGSRNDDGSFSLAKFKERIRDGRNVTAATLAWLERLDVNFAVLQALDAELAATAAKVGRKRNTAQLAEALDKAIARINESFGRLALEKNAQGEWVMRVDDATARYYAAKTTQILAAYRLLSPLDVSYNADGGQTRINSALIRLFARVLPEGSASNAALVGRVLEAINRRMANLLGVPTARVRNALSIRVEESIGYPGVYRWWTNTIFLDSGSTFTRTFLANILNHEAGHLIHVGLTNAAAMGYDEAAAMLRPLEALYPDLKGASELGFAWTPEIQERFVNDFMLALAHSRAFGQDFQAAGLVPEGVP